MLSDNDAKDLFGMSYIRAIASACKCNQAVADRDRESIDLEVFPGSGGEYQYDPHVGIQLKTTSAPDWDGEGLRFALPVKNYDDLRRPSYRKNLLVVLVVPEVRDQWLLVGAIDTVVRHRAYFLDLSNSPATTNQISITVLLPRQNVFGPEALRQILKVADQDVVLL